MGTISQSGADRRGPDFTRIDPALVYGAAFFCASLAFCAKSLFANRLGATTGVLAILGNATCGWSWLATRSLFPRDTKGHRLWPACLVLAVMASSATASGALVEGMLLRVLVNLAGLGSSTMLLLAVAEPLRDLAAQEDNRERQFRMVYAACYVAILAMAVLAVDGAPQGSVAFRLSIPIKTGCSIAAACGYVLAFGYRQRHPLEPSRARSERKPIAANPELGEQLVSLMRDKRLYVEADMRVADLARLAGFPEYKVTQCITGTLGFRNFNQMKNRYRIEEAKRRLTDPKLARLPILTIALDCGFGSIGPFNRAFKAETGMTPQEYRRL